MDNLAGQRNGNYICSNTLQYNNLESIFFQSRDVVRAKNVGGQRQKTIVIDNGSQL